MTFSPQLPYPVAQWPEPKLTAAAITLSPLTPYLLTDGSVEFYGATDTIPAGALVATVRDSGDGTDDIVSGGIAGRSVITNTNGEVFFQ